jgi:hypothetical protein
VGCSRDGKAVRHLPAHLDPRRHTLTNLINTGWPHRVSTSDNCLDSPIFYILDYVDARHRESAYYLLIHERGRRTVPRLGLTARHEPCGRVCGLGAAIHLGVSPHPYMSTAAPLGHPVPGRGSAGLGRSPGRFFYDFKAILRQNLHITRPTAPRWKALTETCQKTTRKGMSAVQAEGQGVGHA